jgi:hypothetical protein
MTVSGGRIKFCRRASIIEFKGRPERVSDAVTKHGALLPRICPSLPRHHRHDASSWLELENLQASHNPTLFNKLDLALQTWDLSLTIEPRRAGLVLQTSSPEHAQSLTRTNQEHIPSLRSSASPSFVRCLVCFTAASSVRYTAHAAQHEPATLTKEVSSLIAWSHFYFSVSRVARDVEAASQGA